MGTSEFETSSQYALTLIVSASSHALSFVGKSEAGLGGTEAPGIQHASQHTEAEASPNSRFTNGSLQSRFHQGRVFIPKWLSELTFTLIKDIAESLNITLSDTVASSLASDVEYRINQVIEVRLYYQRILRVGLPWLYRSGSSSFYATWKTNYDDYRRYWSSTSRS